MNRLIDQYEQVVIDGVESAAIWYDVKYRWWCIEILAGEGYGLSYCSLDSREEALQMARKFRQDARNS